MQCNEQAEELSRFHHELEGVPNSALRLFVKKLIILSFGTVGTRSCASSIRSGRIHVHTSEAKRPAITVRIFFHIYNKPAKIVCHVVDMHLDCVDRTTHYQNRKQ